MTEYAAQVQSLAQKLISTLSAELGLDQGTMQNRLAGVDGELIQSIRTNYYAPVTAEESPNESNLCRLRAHSDPGGLTVLLQNDVAGFEAKKDGLWVEVEAMPNALVVNIGDQIEVKHRGSWSVRYNFCRGQLSAGVPEPNLFPSRPWSLVCCAAGVG